MTVRRYPEEAWLGQGRTASLEESATVYPELQLGLCERLAALVGFSALQKDSSPLRENPPVKFTTSDLGQ